MAKELKLGLTFGYWQAKPPENIVATAREAEALGYDSVWSAEAWGSDAITPLAWIGAHTERIKLGTGIVQLSARTPTSTGMHALTLDHLSEGRLILGLGVSGPQVVEGWYGQPFSKPLARTREYIGIIRQVLERGGPVASPGPHYPLPYTGEGAWGLGKPLRSITHPLRADVPIYMGAEGPKNVALAAEIADGWVGSGGAPAENFVSGVESIKGFAKEKGRDPETLGYSKLINVSVAETKAKAFDLAKEHWGEYYGPNFDVDKSAIYGEPEAVRAGLREFGEADTPEVTLILEPSSLDLAQLELLAKTTDGLMA